MKIWRMRIACWITKAKNTSSEYVIIIALPLQQWLQERVSMLRFHVYCLSCVHSGCVLSLQESCRDRGARIHGMLL
jgi:hypothetical protein